MKNALKQFLQWRKEKEERIRQAKGNKEYLINTFADTTLLKQIIEQCNKDPDLVVTLWTIDGTRLDIKTVHHSNSRRNIINGTEY